ncbi:MAG: Putative oxidoreductase in 4-hydroxyproline catabolic gene cluster [uncultured Paraburkholderia sp.]|nr:MAG: Putative oxidoreductase in 4-hydroxyproline catabolic gene cluster [uncultured Paraburkholderia sp.]CAH2943542.1 MAG: Putative oxidoreductase in 4-hydroxyproline catabolic gene cluster [uncultured Paraburkholderia sp.]
MVKSGMPVRGERVVIAGSGPLLIAARARVVAVVEQAPARRMAARTTQATRVTRVTCGSKAPRSGAATPAAK